MAKQATIYLGNGHISLYTPTIAERFDGITELNVRKLIYTLNVLGFDVEVIPNPNGIIKGSKQNFPSTKE